MGSWLIGPGVLMSENFDITYRLGHLTIIPETLFVKTKDTTIGCAGIQPAYTSTKLVYQFEDADSNVVAQAPVYTVRNSAGQVMGSGNLAAGTYQVTPSGLVQQGNPPNYTIVYQSGTLIVQAKPLAPVISVVNNCNGTSTLSTTAGGALRWSTGATSASITVTAAGSYSLTRTVDGCESEAATAIAAPKTAPATPSITVTNGCGSSTLSTTAAGALLWSTGATSSSITVTNSGTYSVKTTVNGCTSANGVAVAAPKTSPATPGITVTNNCGSSTLSTTATGALLWSTGATTASITVTAGGTYSLKTSVNGCTSGTATAVAAPKSAPPTPVITVVNNCGSSTLSTTATGSLLWSNGATTSSITVTSGGTYSVKTTVNGCSSSSATCVAAPKPVPAAPSVTVTQPTCTVSSGSIMVSSSRTGLSFSINGSTYTNTSGSFTNLAPGVYQVTAKNTTGCISPATSVTILAAKCGSIGDLVFNDANGNGLQDKNEAGIAGVTVKLFTSNSTLVATTTTGASGSYKFTSLAAGTYTVAFTTPSGFAPGKANIGTDDAKDSDPVNGQVTGIMLGTNQQITTVDAGFFPAVLVVGNRVWYDTNNDGINGSSENGIARVTVRLYKDDNNDNQADGTAIATTTTDASGYYQFTTLAPGNYIIGVVRPAGYMSSTVAGRDPDNNVDLDDNGQVSVGEETRSLAITLSMNSEPDGKKSNTNTNLTCDFGLLPDCNCINTSGNLLTNGSFESGNTGWSTSGGILTTGSGYVACGSKNGFNTASNKPSLVYQDVNAAAGTTYTFSGFAGTHSAGLSCTPRLSLIFRSSNGTVLGQTDVPVNWNVDVNFGQLAYYTITAKAPTGTAKVRVQSSIGCNYMKLDALCLRPVTTVQARSAEAGSFVLETETEESLGLDVTASPNPASAVVNIAVKTPDQHTPVHIKVRDMQGRVLIVQKTAANSNTRIHTEQWAAGLYLVEVVQGDQRKVIQLVRARP